MAEYVIFPKAKINLSLDIVSKRENGYHNLKMIMHQVNLKDKITLFENSSGDFLIKTNLSYLPCDDKNILYKTYMEFYNHTKIKPQGFNISLKKNIPVCAGLGGGSSDAAEELIFLNNYHNNPLTKEELLILGEKIGADVPFCIMGGTCLAEGIGEILTPLPPLPKCHIVIAKPQNKGLSTKSIFQMVRLNEINYHPDTSGMIKALEEGDLNGISKRMYNVLEDYSKKESFEILQYKEIFIKKDALGTLMSGSGNSVFGIFDDFKKANECKKEFEKITKQVYLV